MKKTLFLILIGLGTILSCSKKPVEFDEKALNSVSYDLNDNEVTFKDILAKHKGKKIFIDIWASWCHDCIASIPEVKELRKNTDPEKVVFVYLSVDKELLKWKKAVVKYELEGDHYYQKEGWKSDFNNFIELDWIPRYVVVDEQGAIILFKSIEANDENLLKLLQ